MGQCHHKGPSLKQEPPDLSWPEGKGGTTRRWMASEWQINSLPGLPAVKMIWQQITFTKRLTHQSPTPLTSGGNDKLKQNTAYLRVDHHLWGHWTFIRTDPVSVTKLMLGLWVVSLVRACQRTNTYQLTRKLSRVHRIWASWLKPKACLHWPSRLIFVMHRDNIC